MDFVIKRVKVRVFELGSELLYQLVLCQAETQSHHILPFVLLFLASLCDFVVGLIRRGFKSRLVVVHQVIIDLEGLQVVHQALQLGDHGQSLVVVVFIEEVPLNFHVGVLQLCAEGEENLAVYLFLRFALRDRFHI